MSRIIFAGTSEFGIPTLEKIKAQHELVLIITQPDKPSGRNKILAPSPIKLWAQKNNIPLEQPERIKDLELRIKSVEADLMIVAAYGQIIPEDVLNIPSKGSINIHGSVLPQYRGASPIQTTLLNNDFTAGVTILQMDAKMDHGPILGIKTITLNGDETFPQLYKTLSLLSVDLTLDVVSKIFDGNIQPQVQNHQDATYTKLLDRTDGRIDWSSKTVVEIDAQIRALNPEPGTWTMLKGKVVKILEAKKATDNKIDLPGKIYVLNGEIAVKCLDGSLILKRVKPEGKNEMTGKDFLNGLQNLSDKIFIS